MFMLNKLNFITGSNIKICLNLRLRNETFEKTFLKDHQRPPAVFIKALLSGNAAF